jgi:hypothetical protein
VNSYRAFDITAVVITLFVVLLPSPSRDVHVEFESAPRETIERVAALQAQTVAKPDDLDAVVDLTDALVELGSLEAALRTVLGPAERQAASWQVQLAAADAWVQDLEFKQALPYASAAVTACKSDAACTPDWGVRLTLYQTVIARVVESNIDARREPEKLRQLVAEIAPTIHLSDPDPKKRQQELPKPQPPPQP